MKKSSRDHRKAMRGLRTKEVAELKVLLKAPAVLPYTEEDFYDTLEIMAKVRDREIKHLLPPIKYEYTGNSLPHRDTVRNRYNTTTK